MINKIDLNDIEWVDLESPSKEELYEVMRQYDIDPITMHELLEPSLKPRVERFDDYLYFVLHFPSIRDGKTLSEMEVDFIIKKNVLITTRYKASGVFQNFVKALKVAGSTGAYEKQPQKFVFDSAADIFIELVLRMYKMVESQIEEVHDNLEDIEEDIFNSKEKEMVFAISDAGRDILNLRQALDPHLEIIKSLKDNLSSVASNANVHKIAFIENIYYKLRKHTEALARSLTELRETNNTLLSTKQNEVMKIFTILAFVTFPLSLFASIYGMNTKYIPLVGQPHDFWIVIGMMAFATIIMFAYFKHKKWI